MSFRDGQRRYGHVPPVQYPTAGQSQDQPPYLGRRPSFNNGDDAAMFDQNRQQAHGHQHTASRGEDELFLTSPTGSSHSGGRHSHGSTNNALSGYQHQYQASSPPTSSHSTYNPQAFARTPSTASTSLPYHPHPSSRYGSTTSPTSYTPPAPSGYTPAAYNPAAYAGTSVPQRQPTYSGYNNYNQSYGSPTTSQPSSTFGQSPPTSYSSTFQSMQASGNPQASAYEQSYSQSYGNNYGAYATNGANSTSSYAADTSSTPYPIQSQMPVGPAYSADPTSFYSRTTRSDSAASPISSPQIQQHGLTRHPTNAPLPSRPMEEPVWDPSAATPTDEDQAQLQADIMQDIEAELGGRHRPAPINGQNFSDDELQGLRRYNSDLASMHQSSATSNARSNNPTLTVQYDDDDDDPEGTAGLLAMQQADLDDRRFSNVAAFSYSEPATVNPLPPPPEEQSDGTDYGGMDLGALAGGYAGNLAYGSEVAPAPTQDGSRPLPNPTEYSHEAYERAPAFQDAEVDYGGTGGLQAPSAHRLSFDENADERVSINSKQSGSESPYKEDYPDIFYHPGLSSRPLPALPPGPSSDTSSLLSVQQTTRSYHSHSLSNDSRTLYHEGSDYHQSSTTLNSPFPERSISLSSHSHTPQVQAPTRSRTDAAEERRKMARHQMQQQQLAQQQGLPYDGYESGTPSSMTYDMITLPSGRKRKFVPSKLTAGDLKRCAEPWALSGIAAWIREMADGEPDLKQKTVEEALLKLFTAKVPTINVADAELLSTLVSQLMLEAGVLVPEEEWVKFGNGQISGVLPQLTGAGCYASKLHDDDSQGGRCYSYHCMRTLKKANLDELLLEEVKPADWNVHYKVQDAELAEKPKKEIERQHVLHEIVNSEELFINQLEVLRVLYRDHLRNSQPPIIPPNKIEKFLQVVFGKADAVQIVNKDNLLAQLKYRQQEQGPWITGFSDLFREWIRKARDVYIDYASQFPYAEYMVRKESDRNLLFRNFLDQVQKHKRSERLGWQHFLKTPITRLQRYSLLLETVEKKSIRDDEEKANLARAIAEIRNVTMECDTKVAEMQKKVEMMELNSMLVLRPGFHSVLNLDHLGRELIKQGDLQRMGSKGVRWVDTHALLFDHYFILAKVVSPKDGRGEKKYDVSKEPIPMPLLFLDTMNDDPISKQKGITAPLTRTTGTGGSDPRLNKISSNGTERPGLEHVATSSSIGSTSTARLTPVMSTDPEGKILYPFKIKHLGHETYTLYATSAQARAEWVEKIIEGKTRHAKALFSQNAEPFRLRVLADSAFVYDAASAVGRQPGVPIRGTPLDRAVREIEEVYGPGRGPAPVCRAQVNCACGFNAFGKSIIAIGTDYGVYISDATNPRGWMRSVQTSRVTQIAVLEEFSVCLIIADRSLIAYPLDVIAPVSNFPAPSHDNPRRAPQRLAKDVAFFATARMKERMLVFFKRKEGMHNTFKVLEPVFQKSTEKRSRLFGGRRGMGGSTDSFRDYDEFYLPTECYSLNLFQSYIAVSTAKGFELLTLDKKQTMSIPDLKQPAIANIASRIRDQKPLGMFKLNDQEFLLAYEDCAVYVDKHGDVSRTLIMEYSGKQKKATSATMYGQYLLLFNGDYVEVRNAENGRLRQIIAGRDVRCLDFGVRGPTGGNTASNQNNWLGGQTPAGEDSKGTVKISMSHPEQHGVQIVLEMLLNDGHMEK
ncbi:rho guanyl nucleotide exchange factor [Colletotrichum truncatum]|uniref:Rho guanyl nucleotide exchange factor n=1 Tax=Colletotrichum truncatum TaxID=5467 RepID=A0ACC3YZZ2_COLTU|nr:rho guanyl nucleotide exchange factor [Colletotrichum truncatum]KAF6800856.1 rho guanyl nucleotide exchange factor [Colletotrichum truncatum]